MVFFFFKQKTAFEMRMSDCSADVCSSDLLGMPHRGRLNMLANVMAKPYRAVFSEFKGMAYHPDDFQGSGDVKYHLGVSSDREFDGNKECGRASGRATVGQYV